jgi:Raf kinase inhibitor-like YbhB/YbcL family protein
VSSIRLAICIALLSLGYACSAENGNGHTDSGVIQLGDMGPVDVTLDGHVSDSMAGDAALVVHDGTVDALFIEDSGPRDAAIIAVDAMAEPDSMHIADAMPTALFELQSTGFSEGDMIPYRFTCFGEDVQPKLTWSDPPAGTQSFALVLIDESFDFVHYVAINIPADTRSLREGASNNNTLPMGTREIPAYGGGPFHGPCTPPPGPNTYAFRLYALDQETVNFPFSGQMSNRQLSSVFDEHTLAIARLSGTCQPPD